MLFLRAHAQIRCKDVTQKYLQWHYSIYIYLTRYDILILIFFLNIQVTQIKLLNTYQEGI